jgi:hypothetical protein
MHKHTLIVLSIALALIHAGTGAPDTGADACPRGRPHHGLHQPRLNGGSAGGGL